jgi:hypothetical protein
MKRLGVIGLLCLLSACQSTHLPGQPEKTATFPATAADLSACVYRSAQALRSPYLFHRLQVRADKEFLVTATGSNAPIVPKFPKLELRFIGQDQTTTVEIRDTAIQNHELSEDVWATTERCSQQQR